MRDAGLDEGDAAVHLVARDFGVLHRVLARDQADVVVEDRFWVNRVAPLPMETRAKEELLCTATSTRGYMPLQARHYAGTAAPDLMAMVAACDAVVTAVGD